MKSPGITIRPLVEMTGHQWFNEVFFDDVRVPVACRLGPENDGWSVVTYALQYERVGAARYARAALTLDRMAADAEARGLLDDPVLLEKLGEARAVCEAARVLSYRVIDQRAHGLPPSPDTQIARVAGTTADNLVGELALEIYGAESLEEGSFADANFKLAMTAGVAVGATEVQLNLIASRTLGLPRE